MYTRTTPQRPSLYTTKYTKGTLLLGKSKYQLLCTSRYSLSTVDFTTYCLIAAISAISAWCRQAFRHIIYHLWCQVSALLTLYQEIVYNLWPQIFGLPYLVSTALYGGNAATEVLQRLHGHFSELARRQARSEEERARDHQGLRSELGNVSRSIRTLTRNVQWQGENISHEISQHRGQLDRLQTQQRYTSARLSETVRTNQNIRDAIYEIRYIVGEGSNEPLQREREAEQERQVIREEEDQFVISWNDNFEYSDPEDSDVEREQEQEAQANILRGLPSPDSSPTLFNDYSGNEEPDPNSPPGSPRSLEGEQEAPPEILQETENNERPSLPITEANLIRQAIGYATRRAIRRAVWDDSSENSFYPDTTDSESSDPESLSTSSHNSPLFTNN